MKPIEIMPKNHENPKWYFRKLRIIKENLRIQPETNSTYIFLIEVRLDTRFIEFDQFFKQL